DVEDSIGGEAAIDDARVEASAIAQEIIETRQHERKIQIARAQTHHVRSRSDAVVLAARTHTVSGNQTRDECSVPVGLIRVRQVLNVNRLRKARAHAL